MNPTSCPKCGGRLESVVCAGVEVDRCLFCKGIWFDSFEAEQLKAIKGSETLDIGDQETGSQLDQIIDDVECPRCQVTMTRLVDIDQYFISYETCPKCHGVWLDAGEFKKFKDNFKPKGFLGRLKQVFRPTRR
jgi:Zn-finger nucleic acid-binding protein